jgi:hypothetical protein
VAVDVEPEEAQAAREGTCMFSRIFPERVDNASYRGHRLAIWLFIPITILRLMMGVNCIFFTRFVATGDGIPLVTYSAASAETVVSLFALLGLSNLLLALQGIVVLSRYRAMIPFMYLVLLIDYFGSKALLLVYPIARSGAATIGTLSIPTAISLAILAMTLIGFVLSLLRFGSPVRHNPV